MPTISPAKPSHGELLKALGVSDMNTATALLEQGADPNETDRDGSSALHYLTWRNPFDEKMAELLMAHHANIDATTVMGFTPLMKAIFHHNLTALHFFIAHGASLRMRDHGGFAALDHARVGQFPEAVKILEEALAQEKPVTLQQQFIDAIWAKDLPRMKELLEQGVDPNTRDKSYYNGTPLFHAVGYNNIEMAKLLLEYKADPNQGLQNCTALIMAASHGNLAFAELLLDHGADPNLKNNAGETALTLAAQHSPAVFSLLIDRGADLATIDQTTLSTETCAMIEETVTQRRADASHKIALQSQDALRKRRIKTVLHGPGCSA